MDMVIEACRSARKKTLKGGDEGEVVTLLQQSLSEMGMRFVMNQAHSARIPNRPCGFTIAQTGWNQMYSRFRQNQNSRSRKHRQKRQRKDRGQWQKKQRAAASWTERFAW